MSGSTRNQPDIPRPRLLALMGVQAAAFTFLGVVCWWASGRDLQRFIVFNTTDLATGVALGLVLIAIAWAGFRLFPKASEALMRMQAPTYPFLKSRLGPGAIVWLSLCAGIGEEALYRAGLQSWLSDGIGVAPAIVFSSLVFAVSHMARWPVAAIIFGIGILFGTIFWYTGSLLIAIVGHALYDVFALAYLQDRLIALGVFDEAAIEEKLEGDNDHAAD